MKKAFMFAVFALILGMTAKAYAVSLVDVPSGHWAEDAVQKLVDAGLIEGYPDGTFKGDRPMTRYEYAMVVARLMDAIDKKYCTVDKCKGGGGGISEEEFNDLKDTVKKLAAEFKDELAALKVQVDSQGKRIDDIEKRLDQPMVGKLSVDGSLRQRIDIPHTELQRSAANNLFATFYGVQYAQLPTIATPSNLKAGYEAYPVLTFTGTVKPNAKVNLQLSKYLTNTDLVGDSPFNNGSTVSSLGIDFANVELDFTQNVKELDLLKLTTGYQALVLGPLGMLVDNSGIKSSPAIALALSKGAVSITTGAATRGMTGNGAAVSGIGAGTYDAILVSRLGLDINRVKLGFNYMGSGYGKEKGWSGDIDAKLLLDSPFLTGLRGEYLTITDSYTGGAWGTTVSNALGAITKAPKDYSYSLFVDAYKTRRMKVTFGYADTPAVPTLTSLGANPFLEYNMGCALGTDYPNPTARPCISAAFENGRMLFPGGFKGFGLEAGYKVLGDVQLTGKVVMGDYAGGVGLDANRVAVPLRGAKYPGFGLFSVAKPINSDTTFKVEYMQQGKNPILLNRVRGELLINF